MPSDPTYEGSATAVFEEFKAAGEVEAFNTKERAHRRGHFRALPFGISYGGGQAVPARLRPGSHSKLIERLRGSKSLERIANYADGRFGAIVISYYPITD
jgi:hypothetical protein